MHLDNKLHALRSWLSSATPAQSRHTQEPSTLQQPQAARHVAKLTARRREQQTTPHRCALHDIYGAAKSTQTNKQATHVDGQGALIRPLSDFTQPPLAHCCTSLTTTDCCMSRSTWKTTQSCHCVHRQQHRCTDFAPPPRQTSQAHADNNTLLTGEPRPPVNPRQSKLYHTHTRRDFYHKHTKRERRDSAHHTKGSRVRTSSYSCWCLAPICSISVSFC